jgi:hypothetical protein
MAQTMLGVRKYLTDNGINDQDISYDANRKMVQIGGKDFYGATPESDGSTYGTSEALSGALNNYRNQQRNTQLDGLVNTLTQKANSTQPFQYQAPAAFQYNSQSDPIYQDAIKSATQGANVATNNALVSLGRRGIGNSSSATTQANGIQQNAIGKVNSQLLPQLEQQAYGRWQDQANRDYQTQRDTYNSQQDQFRNTASIADLLNGLNQQNFNNEQTQWNNNRTSQQDHINLANTLSQLYGINVDPKDDPALAYSQVAGMKPLNAIQQAFEQLLSESGTTGYFNGKPTLQREGQDANIKIAQQNANTSASKASSSGSGSSVTQQRYNDQQGQRVFEGQVMDELSQLEPSEYEGWLEANRGEITRQLGTSGFEQIKKSVTSSTQKQSTQDSSLRKQAITLAKGDPDWYDESKREALIQEYMGYLQ